MGRMAEPYPYPCPWCGDWPEDGNRTGKYCTPCEAERQAAYRARRKLARLSKWVAEIGTADAERAAMLGAAIVTELGGYTKAAAEIVAYVRQLAASGKAPAQAMKSYQAIVRLMQLSAPAK